MTYDTSSRDRRVNSATMACLTCGIRIHLPRWKYCSDSCADKAYYPKRAHTTSCKECGGPYGPSRPSPRSHFCSLTCQQKTRRRNWRNYQRRERNSDLPQNGPPISSEERIQRALNATGFSRRRPKIALPEGWKDVYVPKDDV